MAEKKVSVIYKCIKWLVKTCYPKIETVGTENLPQEPVLIVGNHSQMNGPIACELYTPGKHFTWCAGEMMKTKEVPGYAYQDFWSRKPRWTRPFYKALSWLIAPLASCIFNNADTIGVYHDTRVIATFKTTVKRLQEGASVVIFPEHDKGYNHILYDFQDRFVDVAKLYYKRTGKAISFVPMYLAPNLKQMHYGKPTVFRPEAPSGEERQRICRYLMDSITEMACNLPEHRVVPYRNIPKKQYPTNREASYENACG